MLFIYLDNNTNKNITNGFNEEDDEPLDLLSTVIDCITCSFVPISFLFNFTVTFLFIHFPSTHRAKIPNILFLMQSISDNLVTISMSFISFELNPFSLNYVLTEHFENLSVFFYGYAMFLPVAVLLLITVERFVAIKYPLEHHTYITIRKIVIAFTFTFILSSLPSIAFILFTYLSYGQFDNLSSLKYEITIGLISVMIVIVVYALLLKAYITIKRSIDTRIHSQGTRTDQRARKMIIQEKKRNRRIFSILVVMCTIYTVTFLPFITINIYHGFTADFTAICDILYNLSVLLYFSSALINPLITIFFKEDYKYTLYKCFKRNALVPAQQNQQPTQQHEQHQPEHHIELTTL